MGGGGTDSPSRNHLVIRSKARLGWLGTDGLTKVTASGRYRLFPQDTATSGPRGLHIRRDPQTEYWVEFRRLVTDNPNVMRGIRILRSYAGSNAVDLLNMNPGSGHGAGDAALLLGHTFSDPEAGIHITPVAIDETKASSIDVVVNFERSSSKEPLTLRGTLSKDATGPGQTVDLAAETVNPDQGPLLYSWDFGDGTYDCGHARTRHAWKQSGRDYLVSAFVTDLKGRTAGWSGLISIGRSTTRKIIGTIDDGGKPLDGVRVSLQPVAYSANASWQEARNRSGDSTLSGSDGKFYFVGLAHELYILRAYKPGYFILPMKLAAPPPHSLKLTATSLSGKRTVHPGWQTTTLSVHATIDGTDELRLSGAGAHWRHFAWNWPSQVTFNGVPMDPHAPRLNSVGSGLLPRGTLLDTAVVRKKSGRGTIDAYLAEHVLVVQFDDPQPGAGDYNLEIEFVVRP